MSELCEAVVDCEHRTAPTTAAGIPSIRTTDIKCGRLDLANANRVSLDTYEKWTCRREPQSGDIILAREAPVGEVGIVPAKTKVCLGQRTVLISPDRDKVNPRYLLYLLMTEDVRSDMAGRSTGSTVAHLNMSDIRELALPQLPSRALQDAIASVLGQLDDKIELNRRMNETLEATARAIFRSWFVDFDPVVAKVDGREPFGMSAETAALFPEHFEESELGPIPAGWTVEPIGDAVRCVGGGTPRTNDRNYWEGGVHPFATPRDMSKLHSPVMLDTERHITDAGVAKISSGQLPAGTMLLSSRAPIGYLAIAEVPMSVNQGIIAMICDKALSNYYMLHWTCQNMDEILSRAGGTTFAEISKRNFRPIPALIPSSPVLDHFKAVAGPLHQRIAENVRESNTLAGIRDTLLPKLLSGETRLREAETIVTTVA